MSDKIRIHFNKPYLTGKEAHYLYQAVYSGKISGNGIFTKKCQSFFENTYNFGKCLLTTSCTDALEMSAILLDIKPGDEVIIPSYTFVSSALPFVRQGAKIVFADSRNDIPNIDEELIESLISEKTKAIVVVHYAGMACNMDIVMDVANRHGLYVVEDAAHSIDSCYKDKPLGGIGHLATFSFHETKNIISGEGGMLVINDKKFVDRAEIIWEKGTNRAAFFRGEIDKYGWVDTGSSFLPSEIIAAFLYAQIESLDLIQGMRKAVWNRYYKELSGLSKEAGIGLPMIPDYAMNNAHMFYIVCNSYKERTALIKHMRSKEILAVFHYLSLHKSKYYGDKHDGRTLSNSDIYTERLLRLPLYNALGVDDQTFIIEEINNFYRAR